MKFARVVFWIAGVWGVLVIAPLFFLKEIIGRAAPPPVTHPEFYYGFAIVTLMWQISFFVIAADPARYRAIMIPPAIAKFAFALFVAALLLQGQVRSEQLFFAPGDLILAILFVAAFLRAKAGVAT